MSSWRKEVSVQGIAEVSLGRQRSPKHDAGPHMGRYVRAANIKDGEFDFSDVKEMNFSPHEREIYALRPGDVLVTEGSGSLSSVGASSVWRGDLPGEVYFQNTLIRVRPRVGVVDGEYLGWWARSAYGSGLFASISGGANIYHLGAERVRSLRLSLPCMEEQRRIAAFLGREVKRIDSLIHVRKRGVEVLEERRSAGVMSAVTGADADRMRSSELRWVEQLPEDWQEVRVGLVASMGSGHTPSRSRPEWWVNCSIPWITTGEVSQIRDDRKEDLTDTRERISELGIANSSAEIHPRGTVVLCRTASAGYSAVMGTDMATSQDFVTWTCGPRLDPYYLLWCLRAMRQDLLGRLAVGSTHKTIYVPDLQMLRIPLPTIDEQLGIVKNIRDDNENIDSAVDGLKRQIELLQERKRALITAAVTGQIDVTTARGADVS